MLGEVGMTHPEDVRRAREHVMQLVKQFEDRRIEVETARNTLGYSDLEWIRFRLENEPTIARILAKIVLPGRAAEANSPPDV